MHRCRSPASFAIDRPPARAEKHVMKRWFSMALLIGALLGLFGQAAAFALAQPVAGQAAGHETALAAAAEMSADCAEMMGLEKQHPGQPCAGMTLDCIAKMGCSSTLMLVAPAAADFPHEYRGGIPMLMPVATLVGLNLSPEPHPPSRLG